MDCSSFPLVSQRVLPLLGQQDRVSVSGPHSTSVGTTNTASPGTTGLRALLLLNWIWDSNKVWSSHQMHLKTQAGTLIFPDSGLQPGLSYPGGSRGLGWAEMVSDLSWWGWNWIEGLFWLSSHHRRDLTQPFLWVGTGLGKSRTGGKKLLELTEKCHHCNTHVSYLGGRVGPQKPPQGFGLFLLCRTLPQP